MVHQHVPLPINSLCWQDVVLSASETLLRLAEGFSGQPSEWDAVSPLGIRNMTPPLRVPAPTCGKILLRCKTHAAAFREHIGVQVCVFKKGVTANVPRRFSAYVKLGFTAMWILHTGDEVGLIHMLEAALIAEFQDCTGCRNSANTGGEGALNRKVREGPPFFVYITGGRADQARRVG